MFASILFNILQYNSVHSLSYNIHSPFAAMKQFFFIMTVCANFLKANIKMWWLSPIWKA